MVLAFLSLLGVVAARIRGQHQLVMGQKQSSEVAVSATADVQLDTNLKINEDQVGRFQRKSDKKWLYCPDITPRCGMRKQSHVPHSLLTKHTSKHTDRQL